ncbi:MAG TPA: PEP-CTERM sorting domain-containing protein [Tepidisphaeraceae bacterium]|jgi:hypothetical protein|nr:PEP-CTERM sorting domain-containing protein [Tepidisphaeraceae bacterium]
MDARTVFSTAAILSLATAAVSFAGTPIDIDLSAAGTPFSEGVRGQATPAINQFRPGAELGNDMAFDLAEGSSIRGVAGGSEAEDYDWETRNGDARDTTLDYLRDARDYNANLIITTNMIGLTAPAPTASNPGGRVYTDESVATVSQLAADWVRYTNIIAQTYHQGDTITDPDDLRVMNSLLWTGTVPGDVHDLLPAPGEAPLPKVEYWEIGNEPRVPLTSSYDISNSPTFLTPNHTKNSTHLYDYSTRYASMTAAMLAVDPTIKVGPCIQSATASTEKELLNSILDKQSNGQYLPIDFISYHPYQKLDTTQPVADIESYLQNVYTGQKAYVDNLHSMIAASGRDPNAVELIASETNVSNYTVNGTVQEGQMAHALGSVETVFSFARLGLSAANYWLWPSDQFDGTQFPVYKAYLGLRDHMGDTLLNVYSQDNTRLYTTRDSKTGEIAIWGLNFSNDTPAQLSLLLTGLNLGAGYSAHLMTLESTTGPTTLFSSNLASYMPGGPSDNVDWVTQTLSNFNLADYSLTLPAATISVLVLDPTAISVPEPASLSLAAIVACVAFRRRRA